MRMSCSVLTGAYLSHCLCCLLVLGYLSIVHIACFLEVSLINTGIERACRFWDQLNEDVAYLCKRLAEFSEAASDELQKRIPDPFLWQLVAGHSRAEKEVRDREEELFRDASDVEKALTRRSQQMHTALSKLVERMTAGKAHPCHEPALASHLSGKIGVAYLWQA